MKKQKKKVLISVYSEKLIWVRRKTITKNLQFYIGIKLNVSIMLKKII